MNNANFPDNRRIHSLSWLSHMVLHRQKRWRARQVPPTSPPRRPRSLSRLPGTALRNGAYRSPRHLLWSARWGRIFPSTQSIHVVNPTLCRRAWCHKKGTHP